MDDPSPVTPPPIDDPVNARPAVRSMGGVFALALGGTLLLVAAPLVLLAMLVMRSEPPLAEAAQPFDLPGLEGGRITQTAFAGRVVVVNVWASWCVPCREEAPVLQRMAREPSPAAFYGVVSSDEPVPARAFAREYGLDYPHAVDDGTFARLHNVTVLPTTLIFAADGSFVGRVEGAVSEARLRALIDDAVATGSPRTAPAP